MGAPHAEVDELRATGGDPHAGRLQGDELRLIALRCRQDDVPLWLLAELPPAPPNDPGPYRRLYDRSEQHDAARRLAQRAGPLPALAPGDMVRLQTYSMAIGRAPLA